MPQGKETKSGRTKAMVFAPLEEHAMEEMCPTIALCPCECCFSFENAATSSSGVLVCLADGLPFCQRFADQHWERTGHTLYLRCAIDAATETARFWLVRLPTLRSLPLAVSIEGGAAVVRADDGVTNLPGCVAKAAARAILATATAVPRLRSTAAEAAATAAKGNAAPVPVVPISNPTGCTSGIGTVIQALFSLAEVRSVYTNASYAATIFRAGPVNPSMCAVAQLCKVGLGLVASTRAGNAAPAISPEALHRMLALWRGRTEPDSTRAKDENPADVFAALMSMLEATETQFIGEQSACHKLFQFPVEERVECGRSHCVAYRWRDEYVLRLPIAQQAAGGNAAVPLQECFAEYTKQQVVEHFQSPLFSSEGTALVTKRMARFPRLLCVALDRFGADGKLANNTPVQAPDSISLEAMRSVGGLQKGEMYLDDCPDELGEAGSAGALGPWEYIEHYRIGKKNELQNVSWQVVCMLEDLGFSELEARKATAITQARMPSDGGAESQQEAAAAATTQSTAQHVAAALRWLVANRRDMDKYFADSREGAQKAGPNASPGKLLSQGVVPDVKPPDNVMQLIAMGFNAQHAAKAVARTKTTTEAVDWILNNINALRDEDEQAAQQEQSNRQKKRENELLLQGSQKQLLHTPKYGPNKDISTYRLVAFVDQRSTPDGDNHFVAYIRARSSDNKPIWIVCDDTNISAATTPTTNCGCLFLYRTL